MQMVAYNFKPEFAAPIRAGTKRQTIRMPRPRHARPGERLQLYTGMRTNHCQKIIADPLCIETSPVRIVIDAKYHRGLQTGIYFYGGLLSREEADAFAQLDGFLCESELMIWFFSVYGTRVFNGEVIRWEPRA